LKFQGRAASWGQNRFATGYQRTITRVLADVNLTTGEKSYETLSFLTNLNYSELVWMITG
jgi:hypothetical protein